MKNINNFKQEGLSLAEQTISPIDQLIDLAVRNRWPLEQVLTYHNEIIQRAIKNY